jgi:DNA adenine methylase
MASHTTKIDMVRQTNQNVEMDYTKKTRMELIALCKEKGVKGYSTKKKDELVAMLGSTATTGGAGTAVATVTAVVAPESVDVVKPFLKWVGGKTQIIDAVLATFPTTIHNYYEPFVGGGSVLLGLLSRVRAGKIVLTGTINASDINSNLIGLYMNIQSNPGALIEETNKLKDEFALCKNTGVNRKPSNLDEALTSPESYYYWVRGRFNALSKEDKMLPAGSAALLFMNKTCFRGVYREGPRGFNVPYGNYTNPSIIDEDHIMAVSELIAGVKFSVAGFADSLRGVEAGDFVYLDPPYAPETGTSFVGYTADGFTLENHAALFKLCNEMAGRGVKMAMSNADVPLVKDAFPSPAYQTKIISCKRSINSKKPDAKTNEVLITN